MPSNRFYRIRHRSNEVEAAAIVMATTRFVSLANVHQFLNPSQFSQLDVAQGSELEVSLCMVRILHQNLLLPEAVHQCLCSAAASNRATIYWNLKVPTASRLMLLPPSAACGF